MAVGGRVDMLLLLYPSHVERRRETASRKHVWNPHGDTINRLMKVFIIFRHIHHHNRNLTGVKFGIYVAFGCETSQFQHFQNTYMLTLFT